MSELRLRPITGDELRAFAVVPSSAFGWSFTQEDVDDWSGVVEYDRTIAAFDGDRIVGTAGAVSFQLTLPGGTTAPAAGVTFVSVLPTHRRRGILTAMMRQQLDDVRERGEPLAILLASESVIYGRFGYGLATTQVRIEIERRHGAFRQNHHTPGIVTLIDAGAAASILPSVYEQVRLQQPGFVNRTEKWWEGWLKDPERHRRGASHRFYVTYEEEGCAQGYLAYRINESWDLGIAQNELRVQDFMTTTPAAYAALWHYCTHFDLVSTISFHSRPVDEPVRWMLADPRRLRFKNVSDHLWARLVDVPAALEARRYLLEGAVSFRVVDRFCPANDGTYCLEAGPDGARCRRVDKEPDIALEVEDLGAAYLGGVPFTTLARAGRIEELSPGAVFQADRLFETPTAPWCANDF